MKTPMIRYAAPAFVSVPTMVAMIAMSTGLAYAGPDETSDASGERPRVPATNGAGLDWGDAPDDSRNPGDYPTLAGSNGARHVIDPDVFLGNRVDSDLDGQPHPHALGDDNDGNDDEDGVIFTSPIVTGGAVTLQVWASVDGHLNAWVDFNGDGDWQSPAEQVFSNQPLVAGSNLLTFTVPASAVPGTTYARFRFTSQSGLDLTPQGGAPDGEVEDCILEIEGGPVDHKMHWAQMPDPTGWDVRAWEPKILADDFRCTQSGPITRITFWGSWLRDEVGELKNVHFSIHEDDRTGEFSKPGELLWEWDVGNENVTIEDGGEGNQGWYDPNTGEFIENDHQRFYKYTVDIPIDIAFRQVEGTIYWLDIQVVSLDGEWGWKTSESAHFEDDAVWGDTPDLSWSELVDPITGESLDLAFMISEGDTLASLGDWVWDDGNQNGIQDPGELGHPGVTVNLYDASNTLVNSTTTNAAGKYYFGGIVPGTYEVEFIRPVGLLFTGQNQGGDDTIDSDADPAGRTGLILLTAGQTDMTWDAGLIDQGPEQSDWGDAPDDPQNTGDYPTLSVSNGAYHVIVPGIHLGNSVDPEPDGQPQIHALGDDNDGNDDEDGVIFTSPIVTGGIVTLQVQASIAGFLNAWVDFNGDGDWQHPIEQVFIGQPLAPGPNSLTFVVPAGVTPGTTYARFRFTSQSGINLTPQRGAPDGEVEDYILEIEDGPVGHKMHWAQLPDPTGWDVRAWKPKILADDFRCTESGPITRITFWGSWREDIVGILENVHLSIHTDDRTGEFSKPGELLWQWDVPGHDVPSELDGEGNQGWYDPNTGEFMVDDHKQFFKYTVDIPVDMAFRQVEGTIYWLDIQVVSFEGEWGWKTSRSAHFEDDAVWADTPDIRWFELIDPITGESLDLAFMISESEQPREIDWGDAPDDPANFGDYPTLALSNGARHIIATDPSGIVYSLGSVIDAEPDGQPTLAADGDDINPILGPDDEDGVTFPTLLIPGVAAVIQVQASHAGYLNAWIDFNGDGDWADGGEYFFVDMPLAPGTNSLGFLFPSTAVPGKAVARFRFTSQPFSALPGLNYRGLAPDGEVEDHLIRIEDAVEVDWGDAPDGSYPTLILNNGARHVIVPGYHMGNLIDGEPNGQPDPGALGDDSNNLPDEDGVIFYPLISGQMSAIDVSLPASTGAGFIDAWIDFNGNGTWELGEQIAPSVPVAPGTNQITFPVPAGIAPVATFVRVRFSSVGGLLPTGLAPDGEVEDYEVKILPEGTPVYDYGDAPDRPYPTLNASGGAAHMLGGPMLGARVDAESDGQPDLQALGDDLNLVFPGGPDDEDGVLFPYPLIAGMGNVVEVTASAPGMVDAWVDFNGNGSWFDPGEQILVSTLVGPGVNIIPIIVPRPPGTATGPTFARFRISSAGGLAPTGFAPDGEVEDHLVDVYEDAVLDWGDAPDPTYQTMLANFGAAHMIDALFLGGSVDPEFDGQQNATATGDDNDGNNDDDGIVFTTELISGYNADVQVTASAAAVAGDLLEAWIDFDGDGTWLQGTDVIIPAMPVNPGPNPFTFTVPAGMAPVYSFARFRISHGGIGDSGYTVGGEVEDYMVPIGKRIASTIQLDSLSAPTTVTLNWPADPGATQYSIYSSTTLAGPFPNNWTLEASGVAALTWSQPFAGPVKFYIVVAFP